MSLKTGRHSKGTRSIFGSISRGVMTALELDDIQSGHFGPGRLNTMPYILLRIDDREAGSG
jgi:hypothetical protein